MPESLRKTPQDRPQNARLRKLYEVIIWRGSGYGKSLGFKGRLMPRYAAQRIAKRLCGRGLDAGIAPVHVFVGADGAAYLKRRYG
ncbi:hypothetical protein ACMHYO_11535 [Allopusillimonas ginsengisoli]|uniref:hypothetical protein n=1 Tax=Allopusillimonas ginsengisoli TaxID=453575 RepID=UPI0039C1569C